MDIGDVAIETCLGIVVGKQTDVLKFPAKDYIRSVRAVEGGKLEGTDCQQGTR